jgi:hypothetical protein
MHPLSRAGLVALVAFACVALVLDAQTGDPKGAPDAKAGDKDPPIKKMPLDKFKMPPGGVLVLVEEGKDLRSYFPRMVVLTPEKHQEMMDKIAQLEKQLKGERRTPHTCKLRAVVEGDTVHVTCELYFQTDANRTPVFVGFKGTQFAEARIRQANRREPGDPAVLDLVADGYVVQPDKAGDYVLVLDLRVPLTGGSAGTERSFDLGLPGAAVTTLKLDLPDAVKEVRWNKINIEKPLPPATEQKSWTVAIGKVPQLQVAWKEPVAAGTNPLRSARGVVTVRIEEAQVVTTAELTLTDLRGKAKEWRLWLPLGAQVKLLSAEGPSLKGNKPNPYLYILTLPAPTTDPVKVLVTVVTPRAGTKPLPVGPFAVQDALPQEGTIEVKLPAEARRTVRPVYSYTPGTLEEREPPRDIPGNEVVAVFKYRDMPIPPKNATKDIAAKVMLPILEMELRPVQGKVETQVEHNFRLRRGDHGWQIAATCKITAKPLDAPVDYLDVQLPRLPAEALHGLAAPLGGFPAGVPWGGLALASQVPVDGEWTLANPSAAVELHYPEALRPQRRVRVKWNQPQSKEFTVTLVGVYTLPAGLEKARLELPYPVSIIHDRGARATITVGPTLELLTPDGDPEPAVPGQHELTKSWERAPTSWDIAWRGARPEFPVRVVADVTFRPRYAHVKQQITWDGAERPRGPAGKPGPLLLRVPPEVKDFKVASPARLSRLDKQTAWIDAPDAATTIAVEYDFPLPAPKMAAAGDHASTKDKGGAESADPATTFRVPLVLPDQATHVEAKLRLWSQPGTVPAVAEPALAGLAWKDMSTEVVAGQDSLPARVLVSEGHVTPLTMRLVPAPATVAAVVAERVLVQVQVDDDGTEQYRARFLLTRLNTTSLEIRLPVPVANLDPKFLLDGKAVPWQPRDATGLLARLNVDPGLYGKAVVLEVQYQLPRGQPTTDGLWHTTLHPPVLEGKAYVGKVRWQVTLPPGLLAVAARGDATTENHWAWRGWLPALEPTQNTGQLEEWLTSQEPGAGSGDSAIAGLAPGEASLVSAAPALEPLRVFRIGRALWFLFCSGAVLLVGLALYQYPPSPRGGLLLLIVFVGGLAGVGWWWPAVLPAVLYGTAPGLFVLAVLLLLQWLLHERYRRQLVFMPGFTRVKAGSSLVRASSSNRSREPSTIDSPPPGDRGEAGLKP